MTKEELEKATGQELIEQRDYCGVDGYYGDYLDDVNAEMLKRFNRLAELEKENAELKKQLEMSNKVYNDNLDYSHHIEEQLTNAKEIIEQLLLLPYANNEEVYGDVTSILDDAEQFLKDSEVEK